MPSTSHSIEIDCREVWKQLSSYPKLSFLHSPSLRGAGCEVALASDVFFHTANTRDVTFLLGFLSADRSQSRLVVNEWTARYVKGLAIIRNNHHHVWRYAVRRASVVGAQARTAKD